MSQWIKTIEYFVGQDDQTPNIAVIEINHPKKTDNGSELVKLLNGSEPFSHFNEETKKYDNFSMMTLSEDSFFQLGLEVFTRLSSDPFYESIIFFDSEIKGFLPVATKQLAQFVDRNMNLERDNTNTLSKTSHDALNRFYKLQTKETEKIENPALQTSLDANEVNQNNINDLINGAVFLIPTRIKKHKVRQDSIDFFLLSQDGEADVTYLPIFTDWDHLSQWYFSPSANGYNTDDLAQIIAVPVQGLVEIRGNLGSAISHIVVNPITNDFILELSANSDNDSE